jgi:hypothetical protein
MKPIYIILLALMTLCLSTKGISVTSPTAKNNTSISDIRQKGAWYYLYDENGKSYKSLSVSDVGEIAGFSSKFFIAQKGNWYNLYDADGKSYKSLSIHDTGSILSVSGNTFTVRKGSWIYTYDKSGKKIASHSAN